MKTLRQYSLAWPYELFGGDGRFSGNGSGSGVTGLYGASTSSVGVSIGALPVLDRAVVAVPATVPSAVDTS